MRIEPLWISRSSKFVNLPKVLVRLVKKEASISWLGDYYFSPRRLLYALYVVYKNETKALNNQIKSLQCQCNDLHKYNQTLVTKINYLKDFEKTVLHNGWRAVITCYHWSCGDGCCSDSWYGVKVYNAQGQCMNEAGGQEHNSKDYCLEFVRQEYGNLPITEDDDYSEYSD